MIRSTFALLENDNFIYHFFYLIIHISKPFIYYSSRDAVFVDIF